MSSEWCAINFPKNNSYSEKAFLKFKCTTTSAANFKHKKNMYFFILIELGKALWNCMTGSCEVNSVNTKVIHWTKIRVAEVESWTEIVLESVLHIENRDF